MDPASVSATAPPTPYRQIKALYMAVCELPEAAAQRAELQRLGATDEQTDEVMRLLGASANPTVLSAPVAAAMAAVAEAVADGELAVGDRLGPWRLLEELGAGGMGRVYLAERDDGLYRQRVALKLLLGRTSPAALERLARERQILARLTHPNIARLIDGGATPRGRPYLVMEHVDGRPIDEHCNAQRLGLGERLALMRMVCDAVAHAHRQLVVHCDIKPSNVLVGADGRAMLLDFGIAQMDEGADGNARPVAFTPRFASPEQMAGEPATAASDVFSLGRLLEALLPPPGLARAAELHAIVARATAAEPQRRYAGVAELADDLQRFARHEPLQALPRRPAYLLRKLARRRWPWLLAGGAALAMAGGFTASLVRERDRAVLAEQRALSEAASAREVSDFVVRLFEGADSSRTGQPEISARSIVDQGRERIAEDLRGQPEQQAVLTHVLGTVYENMGLEEPAMQMYRQAIALEGPGGLNRPAREADLQFKLAFTAVRGGFDLDAESAARRALALREAQRPPDPLGLADAHNALGWMLHTLERRDEGREHLLRALELRRSVTGGRDVDSGKLLSNLSMLERKAGRLAEAEAYARAAVALGEALGEAAVAAMPHWKVPLARALADQGKLDEALAVLRPLVDEVQGRYAAGSSTRIWAQRQLAQLLWEAGRFQPALATLREAERDLATGGNDKGLEGATLQRMLGALLHEMGDLGGAETALRQALALAETKLPADAPMLGRMRLSLADVLQDGGRADEALRLLEARPAAVPLDLEWRLVQAAAELQAGRTSAAADALAASRPWPPDAPLALRGRAGRTQAALDRRQGRAEQALAVLDEALGLLQGPGAGVAAQRLRAALERADLLAGMGRLDQARAQLAALEAGLAALPPRSVLRVRAQRLSQRLG